MADRSLVTLMASGLGSMVTKASVDAIGTSHSDRLAFGLIREPIPGGWQRGLSVDPLGTLTSNGAVYACISHIANDVSKLGFCLKQKLPDGTKQDAPYSSPFWIPLRDPNGYQNTIQFINFWLTTKLMYGNAYALKERDGRGMVSSLYLLDPRRVTPMVTPTGDIYYSLGGTDLAKIPAGKVVPASELIHDRCPALWHPLVGVSPLYACALSGTQGNRIQANSATFFENMSRPSGMLTAPHTIDETTAARLKGEWERNYSGGNIGRLAIAGDGITYMPMTIPAQQAQLIEQLDWTVADVARAFGVPLYKIGAGPMPTSNNTKELEQQYYEDCLQIYIEALELCLTKGLSLPNDMCVEVDLEGLLRMDGATKIEMLTKASGGAYMKPNEARAKANLPPTDGGDQLWKQEQEHSLPALAERDKGPNPFGKAAPTAAPDAAPAPAPTTHSIDAIVAKAISDMRAAAVDSAAAAVEAALTVAKSDTEQAEAAARDAEERATLERAKSDAELLEFVDIIAKEFADA